MSRTRGLVLGTVLLLAAGALSSGCVGRASGAGTASPAPDGTLVVDVHYSKFSVSEVQVRKGQTVRFVIRNHDPIPHELIVGDQAVQDRHERGTEAHHGDRPGEVSVPAGATAETTFAFTATEPGTLLFGCHLPGHWTYGMRGTIRVA
ncbi:MAG: plastocyanin/azurin family copper-binding protein [Acidimicrobiales bacterium]|nr:multicopper oxidase domain-containing protein [Actinomycetota bacterium]